MFDLIAAAALACAVPPHLDRPPATSAGAVRDAMIASNPRLPR